jgi:DNA-binding beta-propeller fold protein YncE
MSVGNTVVDTVGVEASPFGITTTPDGPRAYAVNVNSNSVSVIDAASNTVVAT